MRKFLFLSALFLLPSLTFAAGFANAPLFLSRTPVVAGQTVRIIAVVENSEADSFSGHLVFFDGGTPIGTSTVTLDSGATQTASVGWTPAAGTHAINAELIANDGTLVQQVSASFTVNAPAQPAAPAAESGDSGQSADVESSAQIQQDISNYSPQAASLSQPLFSTIDSLRGTLSTVIQNQLGIAKTNLTQSDAQGLVLGTSTNALPNTTGDFWFILWTLYLYLLTILQFLISNAGVFYPLLAVVFLYLLYKTYRWARRPSY